MRLYVSFYPLDESGNKPKDVNFSVDSLLFKMGDDDYCRFDLHQEEYGEDAGKKGKWLCVSREHEIVYEGKNQDDYVGRTEEYFVNNFKDWTPDEIVIEPYEKDPKKEDTIYTFKDIKVVIVIDDFIHPIKGFDNVHLI